MITKAIKNTYAGTAFGFLFGVFCAGVSVLLGVNIRNAEVVASADCSRLSTLDARINEFVTSAREMREAIFLQQSDIAALRVALGSKLDSNKLDTNNEVGYENNSSRIGANNPVSDAPLGAANDQQDIYAGLHARANSEIASDVFSWEEFTTSEQFNNLPPDQQLKLLSDIVGRANRGEIDMDMLFRD